MPQQAMKEDAESGRPPALEQVPFCIYSTAFQALKRAWGALREVRALQLLVKRMRSCEKVRQGSKWFHRMLNTSFLAGSLIS